MFRVAGLVVICALAGCSQAQLEHQSDSFNRASATAISEQVLLNAVRSSLDLPPSFTKLQKFTAGSLANGSFAPKLPFGLKSPLVYDLGPTLNWSGGVSTIEYLDINNASALSKLNENISYSTIDRYIAQGVDPRLLDTIFVEYMEIDGEFMRGLVAQRKKHCGSRYAENKHTCDELAKAESICRDSTPTTAKGLQLPDGRIVFSVGNRAQTKCEFLGFQAGANLLRLSGFYSDLGKETVYETAKTEDGKTVAVAKHKVAVVIWFEDSEIQKLYVDLEKRRDKKGDKRSAKGGEIRVRERPIITYSFRSPKSLLTYLGELIALQNHAKEPFTPRVLGSGGSPLTVFRVVRGGSPTAVALAVRGPDGEAYFVPQPEYGSEVRDQTMRVLAIASEVINGAISEKDFPAPASIVVRSIQ